MKIAKTITIHAVITIPTNKCTFITTQSSHTTAFFTRLHSLKSQVKKLGQLLSRKVSLFFNRSLRMHGHPTSKRKVPKSGTKPVCKNPGHCSEQQPPCSATETLERASDWEPDCHWLQHRELQHKHLWVNLTQTCTWIP